jgi:hypothetical protein
MLRPWQRRQQAAWLGLSPPPKIAKKSSGFGGALLTNRNKTFVNPGPSSDEDELAGRLKDLVPVVIQKLMLLVVELADLTVRVD